MEKGTLLTELNEKRQKLGQTARVALHYSQAQESVIRELDKERNRATL